MGTIAWLSMEQLVTLVGIGKLGAIEKRIFLKQTGVLFLSVGTSEASVGLKS